MQVTTALSIAHVRTLKMTDDVLSVRYSPNGKFLAVSLLDSTVKVFYQDTLKFFLSLYGHKASLNFASVNCCLQCPFQLPVLSMDISLDSKLIVTCSADKNVKIWGLDFGDCHKSIFAHEESVMQVAFEREKGSHYFWTASKDRLLKYWDGDKVCLTYMGLTHTDGIPDSLKISKNLKDIMARFGRSLSATMESSLSPARTTNPSGFGKNWTNL